MVYVRYNYSIHGVYKPTNITGGHHPVAIGVDFAPLGTAQPCSAAQELPDHTKPTPLRKTSRGFKAALFQRAAKIAAENNMTNLTTGDWIHWMLGESVESKTPMVGASGGVSQFHHYSWLVVWNMNFIFHNIWDVILPTD